MLAGARKPLLFFTNSEWGQANVILATIHEFLLRDEYDIHLASYAPLKSRLEELLKTHAKSYPRPLKIVFDSDNDQDSHRSEDDTLPSLTFHTIAGPSIMETVHRDGLDAALPHAPGVKGAIASYHRLPEFIVRYTVGEYMAAERSAKRIIMTTNPALIIVDSLFNPGLDACYELAGTRPWVVLSPNSFKEFELPLQPRMAFWWKYPALSSAFPFPVPAHLVLANVYLWVRMFIALAGSILDSKSRLSILEKGRGEHGLKGPMPFMNVDKKAPAILCPSLPELDFEMVVRSTTIGCGPMVLPARPVGELDPELGAWLCAEGRRTVLVNLGTHYRMDDGLAVEVALALKMLLDEMPDVQVLWKLVLSSGEQSDVDAVFEKHISTGRIRMEAWLKPDPVALLETGRVVVQVHHGGANTYFECCRFGVPQVVLPAWWDTYDFAARVEYLGIGVFGNKKAAPGAETGELGKALMAVVGNEAMMAKSRLLANVCRQNGEGRVRAHNCIVDMVESQRS